MVYGRECSVWGRSPFIYYEGYALLVEGPLLYHYHIKTRIMHVVHSIEANMKMPSRLYYDTLLLLLLHF